MMNFASTHLDAGAATMAYSLFAASGFVAQIMIAESVHRPECLLSNHSAPAPRFDA